MEGITKFFIFAAVIALIYIFLLSAVQRQSLNDAVKDLWQDKFSGTGLNDIVWMGQPYCNSNESCLTISKCLNISCSCDIESGKCFTNS